MPLGPFMNKSIKVIRICDIIELILFDKYGVLNKLIPALTLDDENGLGLDDIGDAAHQMSTFDHSATCQE